MSDVVLDASAVLALLRDEPGAETVASTIGRAALSAVNLHEVVKELLREGATLEQARSVLDELGLDLHPHDRDGAYAAAALYPLTQQHGSGLGDRACLALGLHLGVPVLTADRAWAKITIDGLVIEQLRDASPETG